jgi:N utilization substance protein A
MSKELLLVVDAVANEKGVPREVIFDAIEAALASAAKKRYPDEEVLTRVVIDHKDGSYETFRRWEVVADDVVMESPDRQIRLMDAVDEAEGVDVGDYIEEQIENPDFGRIAAQAAKQVIVQRVREAERQQVGCVEGSRRRADHRCGQARRARQHLCRPRWQRRRLHPEGQGHSARRAARR